MTRSYLPNDAELKIEQGIARYHVQRPLGMGGFAMTYCAVDTSLERNIAIKEFFPDGCTRKGRNLEPTGDWTVEILGRYVESFNNEGKTLASLQHSNIVQVYDRFLENRTAYIVLEYIEGRTLRQVWTERRAPFPLDEAMNIFRQIAGALSYMHTKKVLHRDLNYNNVMLKPNNQAILIDFGLARKFGASQINTYTPAFFEGFSAPEEYDYPSSQPHERRDVYGLSALLYWMLTGSAPTSALLRRGNHPLSPPHEKVSTISHDLSMVVMKGLALREQERYQTIAEFEEALDATETTPPAVIPPQRPVYRQIPVPSLPPKLSHNSLFCLHLFCCC